MSIKKISSSSSSAFPIIFTKKPWLLCLALISIIVASQLSVFLFAPNCAGEIIAVTPNSDDFTSTSVAPRSGRSFERTTTTSITTLAAAPLNTITSDHRNNKRPLSRPGTCGLPWKQYLRSFTFPAQRHHHTTTSTAITTARVTSKLATATSSLPLVWTVSGGAEYRSYVGDLLHHWYTIEPDVSFLVVALDQETADVVCALGYDAVYWDAPAQSYSRVSDAKLQVTVEWVDRGIDALFIELDVLCRWSPIRLFQEVAQQKNASFVWVGHGKWSPSINFGVYYVRPDPAVGDLFREVSQVLAPSLNESNIRTSSDRIMNFFDQQAVQHCLYVHSQSPNRWYRLSDVNKTNDLFTVCKKHSNFTHASVSTTFITNENPPTPFDSTYCIHPLSSAPFSSFRYKLLTAKVMGFDPIGWRSEERFLKTQTGYLEYMWLKWHGFYNNTKAQKQFKDTIAVLILLSQLSNRTLVLPRHVLDSDFNTYPVYGLVDVVTMEDLVPWRYLSQSDVHPYRNEIIEVSAQDYSSNFTALIEAVQDCSGRFCSIGQFANKNRNQPWNVDLNKTIISKLKWCVKYADMKPSFGVGAFARPCDFWIWDKTGGIYRIKK